MTLLAICNRLFHTSTPLHLRGIPRLDLPKNQLWCRICAEQNLQQAFDWLCRQSRDSHPDSDIWDFRRNRVARMADLQQRLRRGTFQFQPVTLVEIRSPEGRIERREIRPAEDRLVIRAAAQALGPVLQEHLSPHCTHLKGNGGLRKTVQDTQAFIGDHPGFHVIKSDVKGYYANIDHTLLADQFHTLLPHEPELHSLLYQFMRRSTEFGGIYGEVSRGLPLAASLSPLLGALYLSPLDHLAGESGGSFFRRYMDDWVWVLPTRHTLRKSVKKQYAVLQALGVEMHPDKTFINRSDRGFDFLGFHCRPTGLRVSDAALSRRDNKLTRLYEQGASKRRIGQYLVRWFGWVGSIVVMVGVSEGSICNFHLPRDGAEDRSLFCQGGYKAVGGMVEPFSYGMVVGSYLPWIETVDMAVGWIGNNTFMLVGGNREYDGAAQVGNNYGFDAPLGHRYYFAGGRLTEPACTPGIDPGDLVSFSGYLSHEGMWRDFREEIGRPIAYIGNPMGRGGEIQTSINFDKDVMGLSSADILVENGDLMELIPDGGDWNKGFVVNILVKQNGVVDPGYTGPVNINIPCEAVVSRGGIGNTDITLQVMHDGKPKVSIGDLPFRVVEPFDVSISFNEGVRDFDASDITVVNGTAGIVSGSGSTYSSEITAAADGLVTISVGADKAFDFPYSQGNIASDQKTTVYDTARPTVDISGVPTDTNVPFTATFTFSENVSEFEVGDIAVGNGAAENFSGSDSSYTSLIRPGADGQVTIDVAAGIAQDAAGSTNTAAVQATSNYDTTRPTVSINAPLLANTPFTATFSFSEDVSGFDESDITVGNGTADTVSGSGFSYTSLITPTADRLVSIDVADDKAQDAAGNTNTAADQKFTRYDATRPTVSITNVPTATNAPFTATFTFSEHVRGFDESDIIVGNGTAGRTMIVFDLDHDYYTSLITPAADGQVTIDVAADIAQDRCGNTNTAAVQVASNYDGTRPTLTIDAPAQANEGFTATFTFSEDVSGFNVEDITVGNGSAGSVSGIGSSYTSEITPAADGQVTIDVAADKAQDAVGNTNTAAAQATSNYDATRPTLTIDAPAQANAPFTATFTFSEDVSGFDESDITVVNGMADTVSGSGSSYTSLITPTEDGEVTIDVAADKAQDAVGNTNTAADQAVCDYGDTLFIQHILQLLLLKK